MKQKLITLILILAVCGALAPVVINGVRYKVNPFEAALISIMDGTEWSPNYSYRKFRDVHTGMTTNEVKELMGECLAVTHYKDQTQWHYTRGKDGGVMSSSSYSTHFRIVSFGPDGLVSGKMYKFYFD